MVHNISKFSDCANCGACYNICPVQAIHVAEGLFYTVEVDQQKCIQCGKCLEVCPVNKPQYHQSISAAYSLIHKNNKTVMKSSSGGAFSAFAEHILQNNGVVWGACFNDNCDTILFKSTNDVPLDELRRSKYVESLVGDSFLQIRSLVNNGTKVLFCGTPCQVAGLKRFIGSDNPNLFTCDFACGGLPSHLIYRQWLQNLKNRYSAEVITVNFRPKIYGWETHGITVHFSNRKAYRSPAYLDPYFSAFIHKQYSIREYCTKCQFSDNHYSDLILADFWLHKKFPLQNSKSCGISLVLVNSEKGQQLLNACQESVSMEELPLPNAKYNIKPRITAARNLAERAQFLNAVEKIGVSPALLHYCVPTKKDAFIYKAKLIIKQFLRWNQ